MNPKVVYAVFLALTLLIVLPVLSGVNATSVPQAGGHAVLVADGSPGPPPSPNPWLVSEPDLVADGSPGPPPSPNPWLQLEPELVADGSPGPPPSPNPWLLPEAELIAA